MKFLVEEKDELQVLLEGYDVGFANYVVEKLLAEKDVTFAAADYDHPTSRNPVLTLKAASAKKKLLEALKSAEEELKALEKTVSKG